MANLVTSLASLYLSRNIPELEISAATSVKVSVYLGAVYAANRILEERYYADASQRVKVDIEEVVSSKLHPSVPFAPIHSQGDLFGTISIYLDDTAAASFTAVGSGVEHLSDTASNFLTANFLTWQPQSKPVTLNQPEWLTYYFVQAGVMKAKFYNTDGTDKTIVLHNGSIGTCVSVNTQFARLWPLGATTVGGEDLPRHGYIDVWVEDSEGTRLSYIQRYILQPAASLNEVYLCQNSLGGIDTFLFSGERRFIPEMDHTVASYEEKLLAAVTDSKRKYSQNTGASGSREAAWYWELFHSLQSCYLDSGTIRKIVLDSSTIESSNIEDLKSFTFEYRLSDDAGLLNIPRAESLPENIEIPGPGDSLFFLAPRLVDFPEAAIEDGLLIPVQTPFLQQWKKLSVGAIRSWILGLVGTSSIGQSSHTHSNKSVLDRILSFLKLHDSETDVDLDSAIASISKIRNEHLRKDIPDTAAKKITFSEGLVAVSGTDITSIDDGIVEDDAPAEGEGDGIGDGVTEESDALLLGGSLANVDDSADTCADGAALVKSGGIWIPQPGVVSDLAAIKDKVFPFTISSLTGGGTFEKGSVQTVNLAWTYDRTVDSQSINGASLDAALRAVTFEDVSADTSYTLRAASGTASASKTVSALFKPKKYYGTSALTELSNSDVLALASAWASRAQGATSFDCSGGRYPYYIIPTSMIAGIQFWIGGLRNTDWNVTTMDVTNALGHTENYTVYRLNNIQNGTLSIEVR